MILAGLIFCYWHGIAASGKLTKMEPDTIRQTTFAKVNGRILLANRGFAPVPAFSFDHPLGIAFLSIKKNRFSYEPDFSLGLNGKPWMAGNWFRYTFHERENNRFNVGVSPSFFFKTIQLASGEQIVHANRILTFEISNLHKFSEVWSLRFTYQLIHAFDSGAISGNYFDLNVLADLHPSQKLSLQIKPQVFYFNFKGKVDGFFSSIHLSARYQPVPISLYFQGVQSLWSNFPVNHFKWNTGIVYAF